MSKGAYNWSEDKVSFDFLLIQIEGASEEQKIFRTKIDYSLKIGKKFVLELLKLLVFVLSMKLQIINL